MTAPDHTLAERLAKVAKVAQGGGLGDGWPLKNELVDAYRSGQLITLAEHTSVVQAAVAKAVEAERAACADVARRLRDQWRCANGFEGFATGAKIIDDAIRARKGDAL